MWVQGRGRGVGDGSATAFTNPSQPRPFPHDRPRALTESAWASSPCHAHTAIPWGLLGELVHRILVSI